MFFSRPRNAAESANAQLEAALYTFDISANSSSSAWSQWVKKRKFEKVLKLDPERAQQNALEIGNFYTARKQFKMATYFYLAQLRHPSDRDDPDILESIAASYARQAQEAPKDSSDQKNYRKLSDAWFQESTQLRIRLHLPPVLPAPTQHALCPPNSRSSDMSTRQHSQRLRNIPTPP